MRQVIEAVGAFLAAQRQHRRQAAGRSIRGLISGDDGRWEWLARIEREDELSFCSLFPINVPAWRRPAAAEYLMLANDGLMPGHFEMDFHDGQVRYRTGLMIDPGQVPEVETLEEMIGAKFAMMDKHLPGLLLVIYGRMKPHRAIRTVDASGAGCSVISGSSGYGRPTVGAGPAFVHDDRE